MPGRKEFVEVSRANLPDRHVFFLEVVRVLGEAFFLMAEMPALSFQFPTVPVWQEGTTVNYCNGSIHMEHQSKQSQLFNANLTNLLYV